MRAVQGSGVVGKEEGEELVLAVEGGRDLGAGNSLDSLTLFWTTKSDQGGNEVLVLCRRDGAKHGGF